MHNAKIFDRDQAEKKKSKTNEMNTITYHYFPSQKKT